MRVVIDQMRQMDGREKARLLRLSNWGQRPWQQETVGKLSETVRNRKAGWFICQQQKYEVESGQSFETLNLKTERWQAIKIQGAAPRVSLFTAHPRIIQSRDSEWSTAEKFLLMTFPGHSGLTESQVLSQRQLDWRWQFRYTTSAFLLPLPTRAQRGCENKNSLF